MKILFGVLLVLFSFILIEGSFAQSLPLASAAPAISAPASSPASGVMKFLPIIAGLLYFVLDLIVLLNPNLAANGVLHQIQLWLGKASGQVPPAGS